jgi:hypothetical protein
MLVTGKSPYEGMATQWLVHSLDQVKLLQLLDSPVNGYQANLRIVAAGFFVDIQRAQDILAVGNDLYDRLARGCQAVVVLLQAFKPF